MVATRYDSSPARLSTASSAPARTRRAKEAKETEETEGNSARVGPAEIRPQRWPLLTNNAPHRVTADERIGRAVFIGSVTLLIVAWR